MSGSLKSPTSRLLLLLLFPLWLDEPLPFLRLTRFINDPFIAEGVGMLSLFAGEDTTVVGLLVAGGQ